MFRWITRYVLASCLLLSPLCNGLAEPKHAITVADSIEFTRVLRGNDSDSVLISPDGKHYLIVLQRGDIKLNGSWIELQCGRTKTFGPSLRPATIARLFSRSTAPVHELIKNVHWLNDSSAVAFLWDDGRLPTRIVVVNVHKRTLERSIGHSTAIVTYDVSGPGSATAFMAEAQLSLPQPAALKSSGLA